MTGQQDPEVSESLTCSPFAVIRAAESYPVIQEQRADLWFGPVGWERLKRAARRSGTTPLRFLADAISLAVEEKGGA
jgi:hypothetical protein